MQMQPSVGVGWPMLLWIVIVSLTAWDLVWKAIALWFAARRNQLVWYVALVMFNTVGILPISSTSSPSRRATRSSVHRRPRPRQKRSRP